MFTRNSKTNGYAFLAVGSLLGAGIALLFAPQSGKQTRRDLRHFGKTAKNRSEKILLDVSRRADNLTDEVKSVLESGKGYFQKITNA